MPYSPSMIDGLVRRAASATALGALTAGLSSGCAALHSPSCSDLATALAKLPILAQHPDRAVDFHHESGCDPDDGFSYADQQYRTELTRDDIMSFYRAAADADGWLTDAENPTPTSSNSVAQNFRKDVKSTRAHLIVWFPGDVNVPGDPAPKDVYGLDITGS